MKFLHSHDNRQTFFSFSIIASILVQPSIVYVMRKLSVAQFHQLMVTQYRPQPVRGSITAQDKFLRWIEMV